MSEFEGELFIKFQSAGYKGEGENEQWSFPGALLYAVTVISTIGKKHCLKTTQKGLILQNCDKMFKSNVNIQI